MLHLLKLNSPKMETEDERNASGVLDTSNFDKTLTFDNEKHKSFSIWLDDIKLNVVEKSASPTSDFQPHEIALSIDHIATRIFTSLSTPDLFNCRLVCNSWRLISTPCLHSRIRLNIYDFIPGTVLCLPLNKKQNQANHPQKSSRRKTMKEQMTLLEQVSPPNSFPCTKFTLFGSSFHDDLREKFLEENGPYMDELTLTFYQDYTNIPHETDVMGQITRILTKQAMNLRHFSLTVKSKVEWKTPKKEDIAPVNIPLLKSDLEFEEIHTKIKNENSFNVKLKTLHLGDFPSAKVLETVIALSPNLEEMILSNQTNVEFFITPQNRLHLLKKLCLNPFEGRIDKFEIIVLFAMEAKVKQNQEFQLRLSEILLDFYEYNMVQEFNNPVFERKVVETTSKFLECSSSSLEVFTWDGITPFVNVIQWPKVFPRVWKIKLGNPHGLEYDLMGEDREELPKLFPNGFSFGRTFPNLKCVSLYANRWNQSFSNFLTCVNFDLVDSVKDVNIHWQNGPWITQEDFRRLGEAFPNAKITRGKY